MKKIFKLLLISFASLVSSCNTSDSQSEEDREFEAIEARAAAYALSPENVARQAAAMAGEGGEGGSNGSFLWKPVSDSNGNLVVLLPSQYRNVSSITIRGSFGSASASRGSIGNGGRPHYRFGKPGSGYGSNITVFGGGRTWQVSNGGQRTEL